MQFVDIGIFKKMQKIFGKATYYNDSYVLKKS